MLITIMNEKGGGLQFSRPENLPPCCRRANSSLKRSIDTQLLAGMRARVKKIHRDSSCLGVPVGEEPHQIALSNGLQNVRDRKKSYTKPEQRRFVNRCGIVDEDRAPDSGASGREIKP